MPEEKESLRLIIGVVAGISLGIAVGAAASRLTVGDEGLVVVMCAFVGLVIGLTVAVLSGA